jgi:hypothetical protein
MMNVQTILLVVLRLLHILAAVSWLALGGTLTFFVAPAAVAAGENGYRYLKTLFTRTRYTRLIPMVAGTTTLAGILLYLVGGGRFGPVGSAVLGIGALSGLIATIHGGAVTDRSTKALSKVLATVPDGTQPITAATLTELNALATTLLSNSRISFALMALALICMGSARYL